MRPDRPSQLIDYSFSARTRGRVPVGPLRIARTDPLGLATTRRRVGGVDHVVVLPGIHPVELPFAVRRNDPDTGASTVFGAVGDQLDIVSRGYRSGDPMRTVDWRATARRGELMVRTETAATTAATGLLLDVREDVWPDRTAFEWAVDYAASLVAALDERHAPVRLAAGRDMSNDAVVALVELATVAIAAGAPGPCRPPPRPRDRRRAGRAPDHRPRRRERRHAPADAAARGARDGVDRRQEAGAPRPACRLAGRAAGLLRRGRDGPRWLSGRAEA